MVSLRIPLCSLKPILYLLDHAENELQLSFNKIYVDVPVVKAL